MTSLSVLWRQLRSPLVLLLVFAAGASAATGAWTDAVIVAAIVLATVGIGWRREYRAETAIALLLARVQITARVRRGDTWANVPVSAVVPGDVVQLSAGSIVPGDGTLRSATELYLDEAALTGESFPAARREGRVFLGTNVRSGTAEVTIDAVGAATAYGKIAGRLALQRPETELERGLRRFGMLMLVSMLALVIVVFAVNVMLARPPVETLLFSIAIAVGLSPELLPAILAVNLSRAAERLAEEGLLCRHLGSIENLGSMDVLCTDKTGTLTEGVARVAGAFDTAGSASDAVMELAALNAALQTGLSNPIDEALVAAHPPSLDGVRKVGEVPYDFMRKRLSIVVERAGRRMLVAKGAFAHMLEVCTSVAGRGPLDAALRAELDARHDAWCDEGYRVIAVATRSIDDDAVAGPAAEQDLELAGFITFADAAKPDAAEAIASLAKLGVTVKMITGDSRQVARHVAIAVGIDPAHLLTGADLDALTDVALVRAAAQASVFAEVDPNQKERILRALRRGGAVVGFFGDGVNDAPAMHAADVGLSVDSAVDVAKATADLVLTEKHLDVIRRGVELGRHTFANTLKYILTTTSANLGNMISMAVASVALPFLPLTAGQILLNNFLSDVPAIGIAGDRVDRELVARPRRWSARFIGRFMLQFGLLSSVFDGLTFALLLYGFGAHERLFQTGWFVESLFTELAIALIVRTRRPSWQSRPGALLVWTSAAVAVVAFAIPYLPLADALGFVPLPPAVAGAIIGIAAAYALAVEALKTRFYRGER